MRKITRLLAGLAAMASFSAQAVAQTAPTFTPVSGLENLTTGYYQIRVGNGQGYQGYHAQVKGRYMTEASSPHQNWGLGLEDSAAVASNNCSYFYVVHEANSNTVQIQTYSGAFYGNAEAQKSASATSVSISADTDDPTQFKIGSAWMAWTWDGGTSYYVGKSGTASLQTTRFQFSKLNVGREAYSVVAYGAMGTSQKTLTIAGGAPASVTVGGTGGNAGKTVYFESAPTPASITPQNIENYKTFVTVDETAKKISVYYVYEPALKEGAVGAPQGEKLTALCNAFATYEASKTKENADALLQAYAAAAQLPEDGCVYKLYGVQNDGTKQYVVKSGSGFGTTTTEPATDGYWVVQKNGDNYYLASLGGDGYAGNQGTSAQAPLALGLSTLREKAGCLSVTRMQGTQHVYWGTGSNGSLGQFTDRTTEQTGQFYGTWVNNGVTYTTDFAFEKVTDFTPFSVTTVSGDAGSEGELNLATVNLPYAVTLPEGTTAYSVAIDGETARLAEASLSGSVLPANTPVVLSTAAAQAVSLSPAAYAASVETGLEGTLAAKAVTGNAYILSKDDVADPASRFAFFLLDPQSNTIGANKAYYVPTSTAAAPLRLSIGGGTTGIGAAVAEPAADAPLYDLTGRRVAVPAKGVYIRNGKKIYIR